MKRVIFIAIALLYSTMPFAWCTGGDFLSNGAIPCASGLSSNPADIHAYLWIQGKADWTTDGSGGVAAGNCTAGGTIGGCDSDGVMSAQEAPSNCDVYGDSILLADQANSCALGLSAGEYVLFTDWWTSTYDGCPSTSLSERAVLLVYDDTGKYVLQSKSKAGGGWTDWDEIGTSAAIQVPAPQVTYYREFYSDIYMSGIGNVYGSYAAGDAPSSPLITGFRLYFYFGCSTPPTLATSAWVPAESYPPYTTEILDYDLPAATDGLWIGRALIIDGNDAPFVTGYSPVLPPASGTVVTDGDPCSCTGLGIYPTVGCWDCAPYEDVLVDGTELFQGIAMSPSGAPYPYHGTCNVQHSFQFRSRFGDTATCWSDPIYATDTSVADPPVITSVVDNNPYLPSGFNIYFTPGTPAIRHDLYLWGAEGPLLATDFHSGDKTQAYTCHQNWGFSIAAINDTGECQTVYSGTVYGHEDCNKPPEIAAGLSESDALLCSADKTTFNWPSFFGATGYRLYRGTPADLANLPGGAVDNSCLKYDGASTSMDLSGDTPTSGSFFWYLVTACNGSGEGPAGTGRIINSSGGCP
ncbi:MAG TPA: hypothetical protein PKJ37_07710 [Acidobacteriota bacterium]|nr:hypothetical protein [Acidobacteriota bacterium]HNT17759.1 hypothetical protein [Acidobacteriota bacterium]